MYDPIPVSRVNPDAFVPTRGTPQSAGLDLSAPFPFTVPRGKDLRVSLGVAVALPPGHVGLVKDRSSLAARGLHTLGGVIDSDYRGEVAVVFKNLGPADVEFARGDRVAQLVIVPCHLGAAEEVAGLPPTARGAGGFGSTGK